MTVLAKESSYNNLSLLGRKKLKMFATIVALGALVACVASENTYMVLAPYYMRPNSAYTIVVQLLAPRTRPETITAMILDDDQRQIGTEIREVIPPSKNYMKASIQVPSKYLWGRHELVVTGSGDINFTNKTNIYFRSKAVSTFIQTDKSLYKPGQLVRFRVFVTDAQLRPVVTRMTIEIFDSKRNKMKKLTGDNSTAFISGSLQLADFQPEGSWQILVTLTDFRSLRESAYFTVKNYELPKFEVTCTLPPFETASESRPLIGSVTAQYNYGKPVAGVATITVSKRYGNGFFDAKAVRQEVQLVNGAAEFSVPMAALERLSRRIEYETFECECSVTESLTLRTHSDTATTRFHKKSLKVEFHPNQEKSFKKDFPYHVVARVLQQDDRPPPVTTLPLKVRVTYFTETTGQGQVVDTLSGSSFMPPFLDGGIIFEEEQSLQLTDGIASFDLVIPDKVATFKIKAEYQGEKAYLEVQRFRSATGATLKAELLNADNLKVGSTTTLKVACKGGMHHGAVTYVILAKGQVADVGTIDVDPITMVGQTDIQIDVIMVPSARIIAFYVRGDGEIIADGIITMIDDIFLNKVSVAFDQGSAEPGNKVNLALSAAPDSVVHLLVVDKGVRQLGTQNDMSHDRVLNELRRYGDSVYPVFGWGPIRPWRPRSDDACDVFETAQVRIMGDVSCFRFSLWSIQRSPSSFLRMGGGGGGNGMAMVQSESMNSGASRGGSGGEPQTRVREYFPETWIWKDVQLNSTGKAQLSAEVPDTIGQWVANAFATNSLQGLGVAQETANLTVFRSFFITTSLPASVVRGEEVVLKANIFNYADQDLNVRLELDVFSAFSVVLVNRAGTKSTEKGNANKCFMVPKGQATSAYFTILPEKIGTHNIKLTAQSSRLSSGRRFSDAVVKPLTVKAEGEEKEKNLAFLMSLSRQESGGGYPVAQETILLGNVLPPALVPDSLRVQVSTTGDIFERSLKGLDSLIQIPYGCGEQILLRFAPAVFAAKHLNATNRFVGDLEFQEKLKHALETGYQRQMLYQRNNGSFSSFGDADDEGSTWLTAFVLKSFVQAMSLDVIYIDEMVIENAVKYLLDYQNPDGTFENTGSVYQRAMQGATTSSTNSLTAYILISLLEAKQANALTDVPLIRRLDASIASALSYLSSRIPQMTTDYEFAITAYVMAMARYDTEYLELHRKLEASPNRVIEGKSVHWKNEDAYSMEIETAAYSLLAYTKFQRKDDGMNVLFWLIGKRNAYGGFSSTQDTVVALQALSEFASSLIKTAVVNLRITVSVDNVAIRRLSMVKANHDVLQLVQIPTTQLRDNSELRIDVQGEGLLLAEVGLFFNIESDSDPASYHLELTTDDETDARFTLRACTRFLLPGKKSNMAILDVGFPTGYEPDLGGFRKTDRIKKTEMVGGRFMMYFEEIPATLVCVKIGVVKTSLVGLPKRVFGYAYSYYDPDERVSAHYLPANLQNFNLCGKCGQGCGSCASSQMTECGRY